MSRAKYTNNDLLGLMGDYPKFKAYVMEQMERGYWKGTVDWTFSKNRFSDELYNLNKTLLDDMFDGEDEFTITINWSLEIN